MRIRWQLAVLLPLLAPAPAQDPPTRSGGEAAEEQRAPDRNRRRQGFRRGPRRAPIAIQAAFIHPVSGPVIEDGVVLVRGDRILAIGRRDEVEIPDNATLREFPTGHVYPGLIDASTDAFTDPATAGANLDHGLAIVDDLTLRHTRDDQLAAAGITTAYVAGRGGQGAIVRPTNDGFTVWQGKERAGLQMRITGGPTPSHALQRQQQLDARLKAFDDLEKYQKSKADYDKALDKYQKDFEAWLEFHKKKKAEGKPAESTPKPPTGEQPQGRPGRGERGGRRGPGRRGGPPPGGGRSAETGGAGEANAEQLELALAELLAAIAAPPTDQDPQPAPKTPPQGAKPSSGQKPEGKPAEGKSNEPKRPTYPKPLTEDPAKEALLQVLDGDLTLRVEAHRPDELRAALRFLQEKEVPLLVLEKAYGADALANDLAEAGALVVLTDVLPNSMPKIYDQFDPQALPARLQNAGVAFAIASGSARRAPLLPTMAAAAVGKGLPRQAALRAITLTPAEILGIQQDTGSLQIGKFADLVVFDRPLFQSDSRVLLVLGRGRTQYEAK